MTREEAIKLIDDRMCWGRGKWSKHHMPEIDEYWQAGLMAIEALKAQIATDTNVGSKGGDTIYRQAAIELIERMKPYHQEADDIAEMITNMPSAQPEIVYCKDCICGHGEVWLSGNGSADFYGYCGRTQLRVLPYDYCSYVERRADE